MRLGYRFAVVVCGWAGVIGGVVGAQSRPGEPLRPAGGSAVVAGKPADPLTAMLAEARAAHGKIRDYTATFTRQERVNGTLGAEQVAEMKVRVQPPGIYVRFARPETVAGMEVAYSAAARDGRVRYRPAGLEGRKGLLKLDPTDPKFLTAHRHPAPQWGIGGILDRLTAAVSREKNLNNPVEVYTGDYQFTGRPVTRYEILCRRPHAFRYAARMLVYVDHETRLPVRFEAYDDPRPGTKEQDLIESYSYTELRFNTGLGEGTFEL